MAQLEQPFARSAGSGGDAATQRLAAVVQCPQSPSAMSAWAVRRAGSAPRAHALGAARATVGARHVLLALADARVLNRAQSGDLQEKGSRRKCWGHTHGAVG